jgi:excisionase family DNA binding protein
MENNLSGTEKYYTVAEVATTLRTHWQTILQYIRTGELKAFKLGKGYRISEQDLKKFIDNRTTGGKNDTSRSLR